MGFQLGTCLPNTLDQAAQRFLDEVVWGCHTAQSLLDTINGETNEQIVDDALNVLADDDPYRVGPVCMDMNKPWFTPAEWREKLIQTLPVMLEEAKQEAQNDID